MRDKYNKQILKECKNSLVKKTKSGKLQLNSKYTFVLPDLYAFSQHLFLGIENPKGLLNDGEVSCSLFKDSDELDCLRSPHLYIEHCIRKNKINEDTIKWFSSKSIYTSTQDLISKILAFDVDGDKLLVIKDKLLSTIAKRNINRLDVVPLYYDMKKAPSQEININILYDGLKQAYRSGKIGIYSNNISKCWNSGEIDKERLDVIKLLCMESNFSIDSAKTLYMPKRPKNIDNTIKKYTNLKLPHFFIYAKDKNKTSVNDISNSGVDLLNSIVKNRPIKIDKSIGKLNYKNLMNKYNFKYTINKDKILDIYDKYNSKIFFSLKIPEDMKYVNESQLKIYNDFKEYIYINNIDLDEFVNTLIKFLYTDRDSSHKKLLWACFGDIIVNNIKSNIDGTVCQECGCRFENGKYNQSHCNDCIKRQKIEEKQIICCDCGKIFGVNILNTKTIRCEECQKIVNKIYERNKKRKQRMSLLAFEDK